MTEHAIPEDRFLDWFIRYESECAELREEIDDLFEKFARRRGIREGDPREPMLRDYLFGDYEPL